VRNLLQSSKKQIDVMSMFGQWAFVILKSGLRNLVLTLKNYNDPSMPAPTTSLPSGEYLQVLTLYFLPLLSLNFMR